MKRFSFVKALLVALACAAAPAGAAVLDFEGFGLGTIIDDEYANLGVTIRGDHYRQAARNEGVNVAAIFDTNNPTGGDDDLGATFSNSRGLGDLDPGNVLILHEQWKHCRNGVTCGNDPDDVGRRPYAGEFVIEFAEGVRLESIDFFDIEHEENGATPNNEIELFDVLGNPILDDMFFTPDTGGDNTWDRVDLGVDGVGRLHIKMGGSGAIDNIVFSFVPEVVPAANGVIALLLVGGAALRRRRARRS